ncbi:GHKL domain-containing protein [Lactobacillus agrestimuris]|uniref:GHKL domain-containing protein n=1 Tax=Lactobacillus agrestimuris TaxID=2941328 RepID=UPI0020440F5F|nr:GHKL domain-containing protein [Lactobacillus agrestimuris]
MIAVQRKIDKRNKQKLEIEKQKQLEEYAGYLEKSEDELRAFRHDYRNMLNSLKISAREGNTQEVIDLLDKYTQTNLDSKALLKYKDVNHIHIKSIKSIIISKLTEMYDLNIPYNLECRQVIKKIPDVNEIDLIRIIGITCDNAIEESQLMLEKGLKPEIQIMFYSNSKDEFEYEIRNKIHDKNISASQIQKKGFTTKKNHQGLGLTNIRNIESKYPNMTISHTVEDGWFDFYMMIDAEDDE